MFVFLEEIYVCSIDDLNILNLSNFSYILNCSNELNNFIVNPNFFNLGIERPSFMNLNIILQAYDFIKKAYESKKKIILLDKTGKDNAIFMLLVFMIKQYNINLETAYESLKNYIILRPLENYKTIINLEQHIINNNTGIKSIFMSR
jgi:hypothetical protein